MPRRKEEDLFGKPVTRRRPRYEASIEKEDRAELPYRAERVRWLEKIVPRNATYGMPFETYLVFREAKSSFVYAHFVATIVLAASFVEHWLSASLTNLGYEKQANSGLAASVRCARKNKLIHAAILDKVDRLRLIRNPFVHLKEFDHEHKIDRRSFSVKRHPHVILEQDAKDALVIMYTIATHAFERRTYQGAAAGHRQAVTPFAFAKAASNFPAEVRR